MIRGKMTLPLSLLLIAAGGFLLTCCWSENQSNITDSDDSGQGNWSAVSSEQSLSEIDSLRRLKLPREFSLLAAKIIDGDRTLSADQLTQLGSELYQSGFVGTAKLCLHKALSNRHSNHIATLTMARLLYATGQISDAREYLTRLLVTGGMDLQNLPMLGNPDLDWQLDTTWIQQHKPHMADLTTLLGQASIVLRRQDIEHTIVLLDIAEQLPGAGDIIWPRLLRAECFSRSGNNALLADLFANSSYSFRTSSEQALSLQGKLCRNVGETKTAIRCFWEAFRLDPNSILACSQLAELLELQNLPEIALQLRERAAALRDYKDVCRQIHMSKSPTEQQFGFAANSAAKLNCLREAYVWCAIAKQEYPYATWPQKQQAALQSMIHPDDQRFSNLHNWIAAQDFSEYPLPDWHQIRQRIMSAISEDSSPVEFRDDSDLTGINFQFEDAADIDSDTTRLFEFTGGGVAVLDLDLDTLPDLFFTQGGRAPQLGSPNPDTVPQLTSTPTDQLFRNIRGKSFRSATSAACLIDGGYSQGCTSGDFDMDGFPDLYVANIGQNQLFGNNGDGTFTEVELPFKVSWTTSCTLADLTGDGTPDVYEVNYAVAGDVHQMMCRKNGTSVLCKGGSSLVAEQDSLIAGDGQGGFRNITKEAGIETHDGLGLGLVILRLENSDSLSIFVANDGRPNFLFVNQGVTNRPQFSEEAVVRGVAFNGSGYSQACMGVAAGDADGNKSLDLFVTNFFNEYNTLYLQRHGFFHDASESANLVQGSYSRLGFGTQFMDADLDGDLDLVVANGDVMDFSIDNPSRPYAQQPQLFKNHSSGGFQEQSNESLGTAFVRSRIGRGLATLDWNVDGRPDFVVSNIRSLATLATNTTTKTGRFLSLKFVGTRSPRHPVGTNVTIKTSNGELCRQLTAGDGYMACNEYSMLVGLGDQVQPVDLGISWPSGHEQSLSSIPVDSVLTIIEDLGFYSTKSGGEN